MFRRLLLLCLFTLVWAVFLGGTLFASIYGFMKQAEEQRTYAPVNCTVDDCDYTNSTCSCGKGCSRFCIITAFNYTYNNMTKVGHQTIYNVNTSDCRNLFPNGTTTCYASSDDITLDLNSVGSNWASMSIVVIVFAGAISLILTIIIFYLWYQTIMHPKQGWHEDNHLQRRSKW